jgi:hypothetical protein
LPATRDKLGANLGLVDEMLEQAFFCPLHVNDWLGVALGQPALMSLEDDELLDLFVRSAIASPRSSILSYPRAACPWPLAGLALPAPWLVLVQVLASLRHDRPLLFPV